MSEDVCVEGVMVEIVEGPLDKDVREQIMEDLWEYSFDKNVDNKVFFNYEGTLAYIEEPASVYNLMFMDSNQIYIHKNDPRIYSIEETLDEYGVSIKKESARPFRVVYYNGVDSPLDMITLEDFRSKT